MTISRELKFIKMSWNEDLGILSIATYDRQTGEETGRIELNPIYMFSVVRFIISLSQRYFGRGLHYARQKNKTLVQQTVGHPLPEGSEAEE